MQLMENIRVLYKHGKMVIPKCLQHCLVAWFHHYLQYPRRDSLYFDVLERSTNNSSITCQKESQLPDEQAQKTQILKTASKACNHQSLGGIM